MLKYVIIFNNETGSWDGELIKNDSVLHSASDSNVNEVVNKINWQSFHDMMNERSNA